MRIQVYGHIQKLPLQFYADYRTGGEVISRLTNDVAQFTGSSDYRALVWPVAPGLTLIGAAMLLFFLDWQLTLLIFDRHFGDNVDNGVSRPKMIRRASRSCSGYIG